MKAEIVFQEDSIFRDDDFVYRCWGSPLNLGGTVDRRTGKPYNGWSFKADIELGRDGFWRTVRQARSRNARRYDTFMTFADAQLSLIRWFERNFKCVVGRAW